MDHNLLKSSPKVYLAIHDFEYISVIGVLLTLADFDNYKPTKSWNNAAFKLLTKAKR